MDRSQKPLGLFYEWEVAGIVDRDELGLRDGLMQSGASEIATGLG